MAGLTPRPVAESGLGNRSLLTLVTGATGSIGPALVERLLKQGYRVRALVRSSVHSNLPTQVEMIGGDIRDPVVAATAVSGADLIFHLAALLHIVNPPPAARENYENVNVEGTATVVRAAMRAEVKRLVFFSTSAIYGRAAGQILTEKSPPQPNSLYAQTKLAAEQVVLQAKRSDGEPLGTVLRPGAVYGARVKGNYRRLLQSLARGFFIPIGDGRNRRTLIYDRDLAQAAMLAAQHPAAAGQIYNVSDGQFHSLNEIITTMCAALGRPPPRFSLPLRPVRLVVGVLEDGARQLGRQLRVGRETLDKYTEDCAVDSQRIQAELGFVPQFDLNAGWQETIHTLRESEAL